MEAATPLRQTHVSVLGDRVLVDGLVVTDETAVRLASEREQAGEDPVALLLDAIEIGARVLDREQAGANADFVKAEFEKTHERLSGAFTQLMTELMSKSREDIGELMNRSREDLRKQFSAEDGSNPLASFQARALTILKQAALQQDTHLRALHGELAETKLELAKLHAEEEKQLELAEEREKGTAKGRTYEEAVFEAIEAIAVAQGDDAEAVGDYRGETRRTGDVLVAIEGCRGPARGKIVFEAKDRRLSRPKALEELDRARRERGADYAVLVVPTDEELPARTHPLREVQGDKLFVTFDPEVGPLALEVGYALARARVLMARGETEGIDAAALGESIEKAIAALTDVQSVKSKLSGAKTGIDQAYELLEAMTARVRGHLQEVERQLAAEAEEAA